MWVCKVPNLRYTCPTQKWGTPPKKGHGISLQLPDVLQMKRAAFLLHLWMLPQGSQRTHVITRHSHTHISIYTSSYVWLCLGIIGTAHERAPLHHRRRAANSSRSNMHTGCLGGPGYLTPLRYPDVFAGENPNSKQHPVQEVLLFGPQRDSLRVSIRQRKASCSLVRPGARII